MIEIKKSDKMQNLLTTIFSYIETESFINDLNNCKNVSDEYDHLNNSNLRISYNIKLNNSEVVKESPFDDLQKRLIIEKE